MTYFNYHAKAKNLIISNHLLSVTVFNEYHHIKPALVLYFDNSKPIPIRSYRWNEYLPLIYNSKVPILNPSKIDLAQFSSLN